VDGRIYRLRPYFYLHVLDTNTNITSLVVGPKSFVRRDHEQVKKENTQMINLPPRSYCVVKNPALRDADGNVLKTDDGQYQLRFGDLEIRMDNVWKTPFPLYPGEELSQDVTVLTMIKPNSAIRCIATRDFTDGDIPRPAGSEWLVLGPGTFLPRIEVNAVETIDSVVIGPNEALKLKARRACIDSRGNQRKAGETWLVREQGSYLTGIEEENQGKVSAIVLTEKNALHLRALRTFKDVFKQDRKAGEEWLVTNVLAQTHIPDVDEEVVNRSVKVVTLNKSQYCVVLNPVKDGVPQLGIRELRTGERSFFLQPGEQLEEDKVKDAEILGEEEALLLRARESFLDTYFDNLQNKEVTAQRLPGEDWMLKGPCKYTPPVEVKIIDKRSRIPLDANEGIYVRNKKTGKVRTVKGESYMLEANEETWNKELSEDVEALLQQSKVDKGGRRVVQQRDKWKVVTYRVPYNHAVQVYDYKNKVSRVIFGPDLVMLEPDEQFSIISLSGGEPKRPNMVKSLSLMLGPDFLNDTIEVETSDHARLRLSLSYNWKFDVDDKSGHRIFSVRDFVGDTCKAIASRVRGAVAAETFDNFHKNSSNMIKKAVFGKQFGEENYVLKFEANCLCVTNVDIQQVEPVEQKTREALQGSVQLAIKIATDSQQALANVEAQRDEQVAKGKMQRQQLADMCIAEGQRKGLVELKAKTAAVESTGQAKSEAVARCEAALIKANSEVKQAELRAQATRIRYKARLEQQKAKQEQERTHKKAIDDLEIDRKKRESDIEVSKFTSLVSALGPETIEAIARAGPELQAKMLEGLGLQGFLVTDGSSPINLFNTAQGLVGTPGQ